MQSRGTMSLASAVSSSSSTADIPTHRPSGEPIPTSEQLMQVDQAITLTLQEIDANFAKCHQTITGKILPSIRRYGVASHNTWQGARFWHRFFETASDINLVPTYEEEGKAEMSQEHSLSSFTSQDEETSIPRRGKTNEAEAEEDSSGIVRGDAMEIDDSREFSERDFEPPRLSEASRAATERLRASDDDAPGRLEWANIESPFERLKREVDSTIAIGTEKHHRGQALEDRQLVRDLDMLYSARDKVSATPKRVGGTKLATQVLRNQHEQQNKSARKVHATPKRGGANEANPFAAYGHSSRKVEVVDRWNGIADLRKTPLAKVKGDNIKGKQAAKYNDIDNSVGSLDWPTDMSPPVTMQFSVPQKKYAKTPAKAAAQLAVDDLLKTIEGASPATRRNVIQRIGVDSHSIAGSRGTAVNLTSTPLKRGIAKGRKSLPTPPTVTKRMGNTTRLSRGIQETQSPATTSSARLLDEDEDGNDIEEQDEVGLSKLTLTQTSANIDKLLQVETEDDDDSEEEESDSDDEEENNGIPTSILKVAAIRSNKNGSDYPTNSSLASNSRSIDQDTLFGIRDPTAAPASALKQSTKFSSSSDAPTQSSSTTGGSSISRQNYQPINPHLYEQGTVYSGRSMLNDDREDTFSAPSPTPATTSQSRRSK